MSTRFFSGGREVSAAEFERIMAAKRARFGLGAGAPSVPRTGKTVSTLDGVLPNQIKEAVEICRRHGIRGVSFLPNGDIVYESPGARKAWRRLTGRNVGME